jgi:hypothetical protein
MRDENGNTLLVRAAANSLSLVEDLINIVIEVQTKHWTQK